MSSIRQKTIEGIKTGDSFSISRTFREQDVLQFADITRDYNPVHFDARFIRAKDFSGRICHGLLIASMISEIGGQIGWLASEMNFQFKKPVYFGDTVLCTLTITSFNDRGWAEAEAVLQNQAREIVVEASLKGILPGAEERRIMKTMVDEGDPSNKIFPPKNELNAGAIPADGQEKKMEYIIDRLKPNDWEEVRMIYQEGIATGHATFEAEVPKWERWDAAHLAEPRLVVRVGSSIAGWAALGRVSPRAVYAGVAEVSIYIGAQYRGQGIGDTLLAALIAASERIGIWTLQAGIFPENISSINLHKKHGFRELGRREKVGKMSFGELTGTWRDVVLMERRSKVAGLD
jgi:L-amino acid N-acyltransferase YncA/acyl dehydratase